MQSDAELLREHAAQVNEAAFREIVTRHADLVYASALRQVRSPELARDIAQSVFADLVRKAPSLGKTLAESASLVGWLYRSTRFAAHTQMRSDRRRQARERQAMENFDTTSETATDWEQIGPVLDEAMADLSDEDREALLLRYFKNHDFRAIGVALGVSDDAAQKRVSRALERLRAEFSRRGVTIGAGALAAAVSANAVTVGPAGLAAALSTAALTGTTFTTTATATAAKAIVTAVFVVAVGVGIYEARRASVFRVQTQTLQQKQDLLSGQVRQLSQEREDSARALAALLQQGEQLRMDTAEVSRLRRDVARLQTDSQNLARLKQAGSASSSNSGVTGIPFTFAAAVTPSANGGIPPKPDYLVPISNALMEKTNRLKQLFEQMPEKKILEFKYISDKSWPGIAKRLNLETDADIRDAMIYLRDVAKQSFGGQISSALRKFIVANNGDLPTSVLQLKEYIAPPPDEALSARYQLLYSGNFSDVPRSAWGKMAVETGAPVDADDSKFVQVGLDSVGLMDRK